MKREEILDHFAIEAMKASMVGVVFSNTNQLAHVANNAYILAEKMLNSRDEALVRLEKGLVTTWDIDALELTVRTNNCLKASGVFKIGKLVQFSRNDLLKMPNLGRKSLNEVIEQLARVDLNLRGE